MKASQSNGKAKKRSVGKQTDIAKLKKAVNKIRRENKQEIKEYGLFNAVIQQPLGQVYGSTGNGNFSQDITPAPVPGTANDQRLGSEIFIKKLRLHFQFVNQTGCQQPIRWKIVIVAIKGTSRTPSQVVGDMFSVNPFIQLNAGGVSNIKDYNSLRNYDFAGNYKILKVVKGRQSMETFSAGQMVNSVQFEVPFKVPHRVAWNGATTTITHGNIYMFILCDGGNSDTVNPSTLLNVPSVAPNSGMWVNYTSNAYYYDA